MGTFIVGNYRLGDHFQVQGHVEIVPGGVNLHPDKNIILDRHTHRVLVAMSREFWTNAPDGGYLYSTYRTPTYKVYKNRH